MRIIKTSVLVTLLLFNVSLSNAQNSVQTIIDDMTLAPDGALHGVPSNYSWASGAASVSANGEVPRKNFKGEWFEATTSWGQVYIPTTGSNAVNTRCQIRNMRTMLLRKNGTWEVVQDGAPQGAAFREDFANNESMNAGLRDESANGGGISMVVGVRDWAGHNFHFWPSGSRAFVDVNNVVAVFTTCEARLIVDDPSKPDDRSICKNILQMGLDWWLNLNGGWLPDWSANSDAGFSRAKFVTTEWQSVNFCTLTPDQIKANPPVGPVVNIPVIGIALSAAKSSIMEGSIMQIDATFNPTNATNKGITWTSSATSVATISTSGIVTGVSIGNSTITATTNDGSKKATFLITVTGLTGGVPIPAKIETENWVAQSGVQLENTTDNGGGQNAAYIDAGDYMDYLISVPKTGDYILELRVAGTPNGSVQIKKGATVLKTITLPNTGGWQTWQTISTTVNLSAGTQSIRILAETGGWNFNYLEFKNQTITGLELFYQSSLAEMEIYPNPAQSFISINASGPVNVSVFDAFGVNVLSSNIPQIDITSLKNGIYNIVIEKQGAKTIKRLVVSKN